MTPSLARRKRRATRRRSRAPTLVLSATILVLVILAAGMLVFHAGVRAYVHGESLWSKGQKDAVFHLERYLDSGDPQQWRQFEDSLAIPLGDRRARLAMESEPFDRQAARAGLLAGGNHPDDVGVMIFMFRNLQWQRHIAEARKVWAAADTFIVELAAAGTEARRQFEDGRPDPGTVRALERRVRSLNEMLQPLAERFSRVMSAAGRWVTGVFVVAFLVVSLLLLVGGSLALRRSAGRAFESEARFRATFEEAGVGIAHLDLDGNCLTANDALADLLGTTPDALTGAGLDEFVPGDDAPIREDARRLIEEGELRAKTDLRMERTDGRAVWANLTITLVSDIRNRPRHFIAIVEDITERRQLADELAYQARHDPVTGLLNRRAFEERLLGAVRRSVRDELECALIYVDLDRFKTVNDSAGHDAGDELLRQMGPLMHACVRANDTVSRLGGDEFCLLLEGCPRDSVLGLAEKLRAAIHEYRFEWQGRSFSISASIGVVPFGGRGERIERLSPELLVSAADAACYCAKDLGRDKVYVGELDDPALMQQRNQIASLDSLREALEESRFRIMLQPIVPVGEPLNAEATRFEALVRMARPDGEIVPPAKFLPAAERYGLIRRIDLWVLRKVIAWLEAGGGADVAESVAVNLSAVSLHSDAFREEVDALMAATRLPGERICFEITETEAISSLDDARAFIRRMRKRGCRFALDDFGSGFSSFGYLLTLPVQYVKIDGLFVRDVHENLAHEAIVRSVHQVARSMGKQTIAEFVESRPVLDKLAEIGVDFAQGHAIGRPMPMPSNGQPPARGN